jgi:NADH-quinone oxidoreductase subunit J
MSASTLAFYFFALCTLMCAVSVITSRNPVTSAMFLVLTIVSMAGLFVQLHAYFLAAIQILVYAGAVMVLFLFVIMLLDIKQEELRRIKLLGAGIGGLAVGAIGFLFIKALKESKVGEKLAEPTLVGTTHDLGRSLFKNYLLPFEIVSLLLLVAMVGVILLSKKDLK